MRGREARVDRAGPVAGDAWMRARMHVQRQHGSVRGGGACGLKVRKNAAMLLFLQAGAQKCVCLNMFSSALQPPGQAGTLLMQLGRQEAAARAAADEQQQQQQRPPWLRSSATQGGVASLSRSKDSGADLKQQQGVKCG